VGILRVTVIYEAVKELTDVSGKKVLPFVCMGVSSRIHMGGKQAIDLLSKALIEKGANVLPGKNSAGLIP
jgi:hypothetical protein